jgi:hypothetical protein
VARYDINTIDPETLFKVFYGGGGSPDAGRDAIATAMMQQPQQQAQQPPQAPINVSPRPSRSDLSFYDRFYAGSPGFVPGVGPGVGSNPSAPGFERVDPSNVGRPDISDRFPLPQDIPPQQPAGPVQGPQQPADQQFIGPSQEPTSQFIGPNLPITDPRNPYNGQGVVDPNSQPYFVPDFQGAMQNFSPLSGGGDITGGAYLPSGVMAPNGRTQLPYGGVDPEVLFEQPGIPRSGEGRDVQRPTRSR